MKIEITRMIKDKEYCREVFNFFVKHGVIKKTNPVLFGKHLNKSLNNLDFGNFVLSEHKYSIKRKLKGNSFYDWCVVIYYYSIYHCVLALISKAGFESKNHLASISALTYIYYHKRNLLDKEDIEFVIENIHLRGEDIEFVAGSKEIREKASYRVDEEFNLLMAKNLQEKTADFVNKIKLLLEGRAVEIVHEREEKKKKAEEKRDNMKTEEKRDEKIKN